MDILTKENGEKETKGRILCTYINAQKGVDGKRQ